MKNKKKIIISVIAAVLAIVAVVGGVLYFNHKDIQINETIIFTDDGLEKNHSITLEYASGEVNPMDYVENQSDIKVTCNPTKVLLNATGETKVTYSLENGNNLECTFKVEDTVAPVITFKNNDINVDDSETFDVTENIQSVEDPVDGSLVYYEQTPDRIEDSTGNRFYEVGWYTVTKNESEVVVHASDIHGNVSEASYTFSVEEKKEESSEGNKFYSYSALDLDGIGTDSNWDEITTSDWYYSACTYMSDKYSTVQEAVENVILHENENGNMSITENDVRVFCEKDENGNVLYYQAGYEE